MVELPISQENLILVLDLLGTFIFALSGATAAMSHRLDLFGVLTLSFAAGNAGGITRDLIIGATPPAAIDDWRYLAVSLAAGVLTFTYSPVVDRLRSPVQILDAGGLGVFTVSGTTKALAFNLDPVAAVLLGMLTGIGGGIVRDVLTMKVPHVLRRDLYAVAALAGALVVVVGRALGLPGDLSAITGALLCIAIRIISIRRGWQLPGAPQYSKSREDPPPEKSPEKP